MSKAIVSIARLRAPLQTQSAAEAPRRLRKSSHSRDLMLPVLFGALSACLSGSVALAHDFWIEPATFRPEPGSVLAVALRVGENFQGEPVKRNPEKIKQFVLVGPQGEAAIPGTEGADPAGLAPIEKPGLYVLGFRSNHSSIELEAKDFEAYLKEEGLEHILAERAKRGESDKSAREIYSRCAKSIVQAGTSDRTGHDRVLGFPLELIPEQDPGALGVGRELTVRILFNGKPLAGAKIVAMNRDDAKNPRAATSNADGKAAFRLEKPGVWLVKTVHMFPAPPDSKADWESLWGSLTFEIR